MHLPPRGSGVTWRAPAQSATTIPPSATDPRPFPSALNLRGTVRQILPLALAKASRVVPCVLTPEMSWNQIPSMLHNAASLLSPRSCPPALGQATHPPGFESD